MPLFELTAKTSKSKASMSSSPVTSPVLSTTTSEKVKETYARDMWDSHGLKQLSNRLDYEKKSLKAMSGFFGDWAKCSLGACTTLGKMKGLELSSMEQGSLGFCIDRVGELIETESKNWEILSHKIKSHCQNRIVDDLRRVEKVTSKLMSSVQQWHKNESKEMKALNKYKCQYDERKKTVLHVREQIASDRRKLADWKRRDTVSPSKVLSLETAIGTTLSDRLVVAQRDARLSLDAYCKQVANYRAFRLRFDVETSQLLDSLEQCSRERAALVHSVLMSYLQISRVMVEQSVKNIGTIAGHIKDALHADADNGRWIEVSKSGRRKPPLPDPILHADDVSAVVEVRHKLESDWQEENAEDDEDDFDPEAVLAAGRLDSGGEEVAGSSSAMDGKVAGVCGVWRDKWRLLVSCILGRDVDMSLGDPKLDTGFISLSDDEMVSLKRDCVSSLKSKAGRMAFATILNRQRNARDKGLEIMSEKQFDAMCELVNAFLDSVLSDGTPLHVKPAKLVMIMTQSLYIKRHNLTLAVDEESEDREEEAAADGSGDALDGKVAEVATKKMPSYVPVRGDKVYISDRVSGHGLWKLDAFWRECFFESVQQELHKYPLTQCWHAPVELAEAQSRNEAIMFAQLAAYTHNMKEFGMPLAAIVEFVQSQALPKDKLMMLEATLGIPDLDETEAAEEKEEEEVGESKPATARAVFEVREPDSRTLP